MRNNLRPIHPNDAWVVDESNKVVGVQTTNNSDKQIFPTYSLDPTTGSVVGLVGPSGSDFLVVSADAPSDSDGRPDGTIYIQIAP